MNAPRLLINYLKKTKFSRNPLQVFIYRAGAEKLTLIMTGLVFRITISRLSLSYQVTRKVHF